MTTPADFQIRNVTTSGPWSPFSDRGFDCAPGDTLALRLSSSPALDVWQTQFLAPNGTAGRSSGRTALSFPSSGIAATPTSEVQITMPSERGTWAVECQTNGGPGEGGDGRSAFRYIAIRTANLDLRHPLASETDEYIEAGGWAVAIQELEDSLDNAAPGAVPASRKLTGATPIAIASDHAAHDLSADRTISWSPSADVPMGGHKITGLADPGSAQDAATKAYVDAGVGVPTTRVLTAGAGLTGGGDLSADRTFNVGANADASIVVNANDIQVGVLATDGQHGNRGGGSLHALAIAAGAAGFMSGSDKLKLDGIASGAAVASVAVTGPIGNSGSSTAPNITWNPAADVPMGSHKITGLANGASSDDAAAFGQIASALASYVPTSRTLTGSTPITVAGDNSAHDLSANRTLGFAVTADVPWAGHGITGIASLANAGSTMSIGTGTETALSLGHGSITTTLTGILDLILAGIGATTTTGLSLRNTTAADSGTTVQKPPAVLWEGHAFASSTNKTMRIRVRVDPRANGNLDLIIEYDLGSGSYSEAFRWTSSSIGSFATVLQSYAMALGGGGIFHDVFGSGLFFGGSGALQLKNYDSGNPHLTYSDGGWLLQTGGTNERASLDTAGRGRYIAKDAKPTSSSNAVTLNLATSQNQQHTLTENTTVSFSGAVAGMHGRIEFIQPSSSPKTVTMPGDGSGVEYDDAMKALVVANTLIVVANSTRTTLMYQVTDSPGVRVYFYARSTSVIP